MRPTYTNAARCLASGLGLAAAAFAPRVLAVQPEPTRVSGVPPFYVQWTAADGTRSEYSVLFPLFWHRSYGDDYSWSVLNLIDRYGRKEGAPPDPAPSERSLDVWPFYFSRQTGDPETTDRGLLPIAGTITGHLSYARISWVLFPLYVRTEKHGAVETSTPWPIVRVTRGAESGFAVWPLFGNETRPGEFHREFCLWPLIWDNTLQPPEDAPPGATATRQVGFLPFYTSERRAGLTDENYLWPFFGHTDQTAPVRYRETRYLWPFLVQGRGPDRTVDRWGPFYTHSVVQGVDKTWVLWPLWRQVRWEDEGAAQTKTEFAYVLYWSLAQRSLANPAAPPARKLHVWPLFSFWDNGAGRRQWQVLSPFEVWFPGSEETRRTWTPLFALFRHDQPGPGAASSSLLWGAMRWSHDAAGRAEFRLGPLLAVRKGPAGRRVALAGGLIGLERGPGRAGWRPFWMEFSRREPTVSADRR